MTPSPTKQRSNGMELDKLIASLRGWQGDMPDALKADLAAAADALTTMQAREATLIRVLRDAVAYIRELARTDTMILAKHLERKASELEALATSGLDEPTSDDSRRPSA